MLAENALHIYTDGSSLPAPRRGDIGIRFLLIDSQGHEQIVDSRHAGYRAATNNQMELEACIEALEEARDRGLATSVSKIVVHADSQYVVGNVNQAKFTWPKQRWLTRPGAHFADFATPVRRNSPPWFAGFRRVLGGRASGRRRASIHPLILTSFKLR
jgi:ribonuclease HI